MNEAAATWKGGLLDAGFRFIVRRTNGVVTLATWLEPHLVQPGDVDCTDMTDDEFDAEMAK